ncbi:MULTISPECIES: hypothetical protein [unclassified Bradyrhizobium]|uniref:hypothetical protein n=1 Tax=unclassified Bradyrhizobium TaxID=2631580 RepID=UPI0028E4B3AE|nr:MULTISPECIES: hypothetical protein [unclassified Bradyrhizobium]
MRKLLIAAGPSEQPFRLMLQVDDEGSASNQRGRRPSGAGRAKRADGRAKRSARPFRWAQPSRAMAAILRGLRATLLAFSPVEIRSDVSVRQEALRDMSPVVPRLRAVGGCGGTREAAAVPAGALNAMVCAAATPRHHVRSMETPRAQRRRLRAC